jgi:small nuclear ribonucleoprotein (snRNP)-like protein
MSEERELLRGKLAGFLSHPQLVLTTKRLIIGERSINLNEITEAYAEQERLQSKLVIRITNGTTEELVISPEKSVSFLTFLSGSLDAQESEMRAGSKATTDRWVNLINIQLMRCQSENLKSGSKCPICGKEIPQGNYTFCPFCGNSLKP